MKPKEVLIIGSGVSGCAIALALAKRDIRVTIIAPPSDLRSYPCSSLPSSIVNASQSLSFPNACPRALEQFHASAKKNIDELLGSFQETLDVYKSMQEQLKSHPQVEWLTKYSALELITLHQHSEKNADIYKRATCLGVYGYHHGTHQVEPILAKETILATGSPTSLFQYSTRSSSARGEGLAIAHRAGARLLPTTHIQFHPLCLYESGQACYPLPLDLFRSGAKILNNQRNAVLTENEINGDLYKELLTTKSDHLWLDLTALDPVEIKMAFPAIDAYCLSKGFNIAKDLLPIVPAAQYANGGIAIDKTAQTTVQRLRAIGEVAATGLFEKNRDDVSSIMESLIWAVAAAEDIAKQINKFAYYFPDVVEWKKADKKEADSLDQDIWLIRKILWLYGGISRDKKQLKKATLLLENLQLQYDEASISVEQKMTLNALQAALLLVNPR